MSIMLMLLLFYDNIFILMTYFMVRVHLQIKFSRIVLTHY